MADVQPSCAQRGLSRETMADVSGDDVLEIVDDDPQAELPERTGRWQVTGTTLFTLYPLAIAIGLALFVLSFVLPEPAAVLVTRILSVIALLLAAVFAIPGIA